MAGSTLLLIGIGAALFKLMLVAGFIVWRRRWLRRGPMGSPAASSGLDAKWYSAPRRL